MRKQAVSFQTVVEKLCYPYKVFGVIVYGGVNEDIYKLNDDTLWSGYPRNYTVQGTEIFEQVKKYILNDEPNKAEPLLERLYGTYGQYYLPAGTLKVTADYGAYSDYKRSLSLKEAVHHVDFGTELEGGGPDLPTDERLKA